MSLQMMTSPVPLYFVRLPDHDDEPAKIVAGAFNALNHTMLVRGLWSPDLWDALRNHPMFSEPVPLLLLADMDETLGVVLRVLTPVRLRDMPEDLRAEIVAQRGAQREPWQPAEAVPSQALVSVELGRLIRAPRMFMAGGDLLAESQHMFARALRGEAK